MTTSSDTIAQLRSLVPERALTHIEALHFTELQATRLLNLVAISEPPVPSEVITGLPRIRVERAFPLSASGATRWIKGRWVIVLNAGEPAVRQRFSLAHEFKHVLDSPFGQGRLLYPATPGMTSEQRVESTCDYFAACLFMPRVWVKRAWCGGTQDPQVLARRFGVSVQAMQIRLLALGLTEQPRRCGGRVYFRAAPVAA